MLRVRCLVLGRDERTVLRALGGAGLLHLIREAGPDTAPLPPQAAEETRTAWNRLMERAEDLRTRLELPACRPIPVENPAGALQAMEDQASGLLAHREELQRRGEARSTLAERLQGYLGMGIPQDRIGEGSFLHLALGTLPGGQLPDLPGRALTLSGPGLGGRLSVAILCPRGERAALEEALRRSGFQGAPLPEGGGGPLDDYIRDLRREAEALTGEEAQAAASLRDFAGSIAAPLAGILDRCRLELGILEAREHCTRTGATVLLQGWVPATDAPGLEACLRASTGGRCVLETVEPGPEEEAPVLLRPRPLLRPFEALVASYGLPRYRELSPAPFLAVSYLLMFGMMFGDLGHGAVLVLAGLLARRRWPDGGLLLLGGGISSATFGAIYGSCFGLARFKDLALWHDPLEGDPLHLMGLAIGFGALMISLGLVLNILNHLRRRDVPGALLDRFGLAGLVFYWGALGLILWRGPLPWPSLALPLLPVLAWVLHARRWGLTAALVEAFEAVLGFLANTISFVRLAAYAMSHAALLAATLMMADAVGPSLAWLVLITGNLAAILLEGIIASVQALRLEYYEFFSKFFSGAGRPFRPFRLHAQGGEA